MNRVAKLVIIDADDMYLLMHRGNHPTFGNDPDLPGGTLEPGEEPIDTMIREVKEEAGIEIHSDDVREVYSGTNYSKDKTEYTLFLVKLDHRPTIEMSWEHSSYEWIDMNTFLHKASNAKDTFMHMTASELRNREPIA